MMMMMILMMMMMCVYCSLRKGWWSSLQPSQSSSSSLPWLLMIIILPVVASELEDDHDHVCLLWSQSLSLSSSKALWGMDESWKCCILTTPIIHVWRKAGGHLFPHWKDHLSFRSWLRNIFLPCWVQNIPRKLGQYHGCWCIGSLHCQTTTSREIYDSGEIGNCLP